ncbi:protein lifeguard 1-like [Procambarus clarkii]|uniref:protein lifeguard 1-like n=1 Tax=Procambarus clarkii TaxID=6728 RepID=UPI001E6777EA|nr:protein lifeguard 1-like [Procambarus clarkii]XP_045619475.1 protein lifeguard 1-like [Procambarus clarkii]XP_045619476.1 protein lifeguard 1-like [Procambarus clarkii]XP_045619477.1 protein lifeguard 1-like [Procambarus clarkii]
MSSGVMDIEGNGEFEFSDKSIRMGFIRKVYALLTAQLLITFGIVAIFVWVPQVNTFAYENTSLFWSAFGLTIAMVILLSCCGNMRRKTPYNYLALFTFTICEGYLLGCCSATFEAWEVAAAIGVTIVITVALTIFAFQTKWDFTMMGGLLYVFLISLLMFGIFALIFQSQVLNIMYASLGALLFSAYLVFDTQLILGGKHKLALSPEEYVFAALNLYLDVINLFLYILAIFGGGRN